MHKSNANASIVVIGDSIINSFNDVHDLNKFFGIVFNLPKNLSERIPPKV